jgi:RNA polymerase sigma factor (sigma-70 family)
MQRVTRAEVLRNVQTLFDAGTIGNLTDGQLLERFTSRYGEAAQLAFAVLVQRHGPMVLRTCRSILRDPHAAEDAFQATFLVLVRRARSLWVRDSLGAWLHQVAYRTASCARSTAARRRRHERRAAERASSMVRLEVPDDELGRAVHEELALLPKPFRAAAVLCLVEGLSHEQAALRLGCPVGTLESRLARARARLRTRLSRRGLAPTTGALTAALAAGRGLAAMPADLMETTLRASVLVAKSRAPVAEVVSAGVLALVEGVSRRMSMTVMKMMVGGVVLAAGLAVIGTRAGADQRDQAGEEKQASAAPRQTHGYRLVCPVNTREACISCHTSGVATRPIPVQTGGDQPSEIVARVNDLSITRAELIERCLAKYGAKELELLINTAIIERECQRHGISVAAKDVESEAARVATRAGMTPDAWYRTLEKERGLSKDVYLRDVLRTSLMMEKLSAIGSVANFEELKNTAHVEVYFAEPRARGASVDQAADASRQHRLGAV